MPTAQMKLSGGFGKDVAARKRRIEEIRERARSLHKRWSEVFGPDDTPVPIDRAWARASSAVERVQQSGVERKLEQAEEELDQAEWVIETAGGGRGGKDGE